MKNEINYIKGDATQPIGEGNKIIIHVCNDIGGWGRGFVLALSSKWKQPEESYRLWAKSKDNFKLGEIQTVQVESDTWVGNMIGQRDTKFAENGTPPVRYDAINKCLQKIGEFALENNSSVHLPRIGCGLAGGQWTEVEPLLIKNLIDRNISVTVYDFD